MNALSPRIPLVFALLALLVWTGCDSNDDGAEDANVIGTYSFTQFNFQPDGSAVAPANVLATLDVNNTSMRFFANGRFSLEYRFAGTTADLLGGGTYNVDGDRVNIDFDGRPDGKLILPERFSLTAINLGAQLQGNIDQRVDLSEFSSAYDGLGDVDGTLQLRLNKR